MAEGITAESVLSKIIQGHLECSICCIRYTEPKTLDYSHSFCLRCLEELKQSQDPDNNKLTCPLCQRETILPQDGVTKLPSNYPLITLLEEVAKQEQLLQGEGSEIRSKIICQACDEENEAISRCMDCEHYLCQECQRSHQRLAALKNHQIKTLAELQKESASHKESKCDIHHNQDLCFYCITCEKLICKLCTTSSHKEPMHSFVDFNMTMDICLKEACESNLQIHNCDAHAKILGNFELLRNRLSIMFFETKTHISQIAEQKINRIRQEEVQLHQQAQVIYRRKDKKLAELILAEKTVKKCHSAMTDSDRLEILKHRQELLFEYRDVNVREEQAGDVTYDLSFIGFNEIQNEVEIGTLLLKEKWEHMSKSNITGQFIASLSTGDIIIVKTDAITISILRPVGKVVYTII